MAEEQDKNENEVTRREEEILAFWNKNDIFNKSLKKDSPKGEYVFYDGPPFATGLPHHGHILAGTIKDTIPRYQTMRGHRVERKWGWDCHGLPLENIIEKKLGLKTKKDIEELGVMEFNEAARDAVLEFADDWKRIVPRLGRWADMEHDYKTMDSSYTESVWWVFKELHEKGLVYKGFKSMHLCPRCGTTLSNFEVNLGYKDIKDIAVTVKLPLLDERGNKTDTSLLVWTTTPWTLPGNMAAAVHEDFDYAKVEVETEGGAEVVILAKEKIDMLPESHNILEIFKGKELVGKSYEPPFHYFKNSEGKVSSMNQNLQGDFEKAWKIYHAPYVDLEEGTGAVHLAPAYGSDDMVLAKEHGVPVVHHVGEDGKFLPLVTDLVGQQVKPKDEEGGASHLDADIEIVKKLKESEKLFKKENVTHSYPHCWRCDTPLLNYATSSWFVEVTKIKDKLVKENKKVHWVPEHVGHARFGNWLEGAVDWAVSRQRYWGAPLPVWVDPKTDEYKVLGSLEAIQEYVPRSGNEYFIMRHGESESNLTAVISSNKENHDALTQKGIEQVKGAFREVKKQGIELIFHSGFERTKQTAEMVAAELGINAENIIEDERISELQMTDTFEGKGWDEYNAQYETWEGRYTKNIEGFENRRDVQKRMGQFLYDVETKYKNKKILVVSHAGALFALECAAAGADISEAWRIHEEHGYLHNAEIRELPFTPMPHNRNFVLDYHRPYIDEIELYDGETRLERVPDVFDCWFESGSMPYGQQHYPFENTDIFEPRKERGYPADFIAESVDQTRGWFYSLIVLGTALFGQSPYKNVITNGLVLAEDGKKMSKSLKNFPDPIDVVNNYGADTLRFYLLSSSIIRGEDLNFSEKSVAELGRKNIGRLANVLAFYELYKDDSVLPGEAEKSKHVLDKWILARTNELISEATNGMENYELDKATRPVTDFIDDLSVWYLRRSRDRLKGADEDDKRAALATLRYVFLKLSLVIAPPMPFFAEYLYQQVKTGDNPESVHLAEWPEAMKFDEKVILPMRQTRLAVSHAHEGRAMLNVKVRQPLPELRLNKAFKLSPEHEGLIRDEVNVKKITYFEDDAEIENYRNQSDWKIVDNIGNLQLAVGLSTLITPELKAEGEVRELIRLIQDLRKKAGLTPHDRVSVMIETDEDGKKIIDLHKEMIIETINAEILEMTKNDGTELSVEGRMYKVMMKKV